MKEHSRDFNVSDHFGSWVFLSLLTALITPVSYAFIDLVYLPEWMHPVAGVCRFGLVLLGGAGLAVRYLNPDWIVRNWLGALLGVYAYHVAILLWFEYESIDLLRSRYYLGIITITGLTQLFRVQYEVLVMYVLSIGVYIFLLWGSPTLGDAVFDFLTIGIFFFGMAYNIFKYQRKLWGEIKQRDDLSALINHGWTFPLQAIADLANGIKASVSSEVAGQVELIEHQARILQAESEAIVNSSAGHRRARSPVMETVAVWPVLELAVRSYTVVKKGRIEVVTPVPEGLRVRGTEQDLFRVFTVLLSNSLSYSPDRRCLIAVRSDSESIELEFTNNLTGPLRVDQVFDKYVTFSGGTGIGLYDAKTVVEENLAGQIFCQLAGEGAVKFIIRLPTAP